MNVEDIIQMSHTVIDERTIKWHKRLWHIIRKNTRWLLLLLALDISVTITGWAIKYYWIGILPEDSSKFESLFSAGAAADFLANFVYYVLFGTISLLTSVIHLGLLPLYAHLKGQFSQGITLAIFQLHNKNAMLLFFGGYLPRMLFLKTAYLLMICTSLRIGASTVKALREKRKTTEFKQANKDILTILPLLLILWILASAVDAYISVPIFNLVVKN